MGSILPDSLGDVLIVSFPNSAWQSNCYVLAPETGRGCVVVDPGPGAATVLPELLEQSALTVEAVLATHGHVDHVGDAAAIANAHGVPVWIAAADEHLLTDPAAGLGPQGRFMLAQMRVSAQLPAPDEIRHLVDGQTVDLAGLQITPHAVPGHTPGCMLLTVPYDGPEHSQICLSGDVLFAGAIGRTDLPGGDHAQMITSLSQKVATLAPDTAVLPGHGDTTVVAHELATNPYLRGIR